LFGEQKKSASSRVISFTPPDRYLRLLINTFCLFNNAYNIPRMYARNFMKEHKKEQKTSYMTMPENVAVWRLARIPIVVFSCNGSTNSY